VALSTYLGSATIELYGSLHRVDSSNKPIGLASTNTALARVVATRAMTTTSAYYAFDLPVTPLTPGTKYAFVISIKTMPGGTGLSWRLSPSGAPTPSNLYVTYMYSSNSGSSWSSSSSANTVRLQFGAAVSGPLKRAPRCAAPAPAPAACCGGARGCPLATARRLDLQFFLFFCH